MDKLVTFFGYISSYVASSRSNGRSDGSKRSNARRPRKSQDSSTDSGFTNTTNGGLKGDSSEETKLNRAKTSAFTETSLDTLRGEVREIKPSPLSGYDGLQSDSAKKSAKMNDFSDKNPSCLPPVDRNQSSSTIAKKGGMKTSFKGENLARPSFQGLSNSNTGGTLPSACKQHPEEMLSKEAHRGKGKLGVDKGLRRTKGLPNIFSNVGKSFVETNQLAVFDRASFRKKSACDKEPVVPVEKHAREDGGSYGNEQKSQMEVPKAKRKKKKGKGKGKKGEERHNEQQGNEQDREGGVKEGDAGINRQAEHERKLAEKATAEDTEGVKNSSRRQRPGTALGRWIKKRSNAVAPAPLDDSVSVEIGCAQTKEEASQLNKERLKDASERSDFCPSTTPRVTTVLVSECREKISMWRRKKNHV